MDSGKAAGPGQGTAAFEGESVAGRGSRLNVELLRKVRDAIADEKNAVGFDMGDFGHKASEYHCGTAACIGGHAILLGAKNRYRWADGELKPRRGRSCSDLAAEVLGLRDWNDEWDEWEASEDAEYLFYGYWSRKYISDITRAEAVAYLDRCIAAGRIVRR